MALGFILVLSYFNSSFVFISQPLCSEGDVPVAAEHAGTALEMASQCSEGSTEAEGMGLSRVLPLGVLNCTLERGSLF